MSTNWKTPDLIGSIAMVVALGCAMVSAVTKSYEILFSGIAIIFISVTFKLVALRRHRRSKGQK